MENTADINNISYKNFETACHLAAETCIPKKASKRKKNPWETEKILSKRTALKNASALQRANPNVTNIKKVKQAKKDLRLSYEQEQAAYVQSKIDEIKSAADNKQSAIAWKTVNKISSRKKNNKSKDKS